MRRFSGIAAQFAGGGLVIIFLVILTIGLILIGMPDKGGLFFRDLLIYFGLQLLFGAAISSIVIAVCEWSRNMAAGIGITMAVLIFSPLLVQGMDLLLSVLRLKISISRYWILNLRPIDSIRGIYGVTIGFPSLSSNGVKPAAFPFL